MDTVYGHWCNILKKRYPTEQSGYIKNIHVASNDEQGYRFEFFQLTNGTDIEIQQFVKDINNEWKPIKIDVNKCIQRCKSYSYLPPCNIL